MLRKRLARSPVGFIELCRPTKAIRPPSGPLWIHEIKHDGFRLLVRGEGSRVRCFTRGGHDWADRFPAIVAAARAIKARSFLLDGEAIVCGPDGRADFEALRSRRRDGDVILFAFDLIELKGEDWRGRQLVDRKTRLASLLARRSDGIQFTEQLEHDGELVFTHACRMGWRASCRNGSMRPIGADPRSCG